MSARKLFALGLLLVVFFSNNFFVFPSHAQTPSTTTLYFPAQEKVLDEKGSVVEEKTYLPLPHTIAVKQEDGLFYLHQDHLSSTRLITDNQGNKLEEDDYYPYGSLVASASATISDKLYTSQTKDDSTNLYYYHARYYNPQTAHFLSADEAQGPNRYLYVAGNPISRNDPTGNDVGVPIRNLGLTEEELAYEPSPRETFWQELEAVGISLAYQVSPWIPEKWEQRLSGEEKAAAIVNQSLIGMVGMISVGNQYVAKSGQKLIIDPSKDKSLQVLLKEAREYLRVHRGSSSTPRAKVVAEFLHSRITYNRAGQQEIYRSWRRIFSKTMLGDFINSGVCREKALMGHVILADMGKESWAVAGKTAGGRHMWVEMVDSGTGVWYVMEPTLRESMGLIKRFGRYMERAKYYAEIGVVRESLKYFQFVKP